MDAPRLPALDLAAASVPVGPAAAGGVQRRQMHATWRPVAGAAAVEAKCIAVLMQRPGARYYEGMAVRILFPSATEFEYEPGGEAGEYCFRFVVIAATTRSEFVDRCIELPARGPIPPGSSEDAGEVVGSPDSDSSLSLGGRDLTSAPVLVAVGFAGALAALLSFGPVTLRRLLRTRR